MEVALKTMQEAIAGAIYNIHGIKPNYNNVMNLYDVLVTKVTTIHTNGGWYFYNKYLWII